MSLLNKCIKMLSKNYKKTSSKKNQFIIVHYQGCISSGKSIANYFSKTDNKVSTHYIVDETNVYNCVPDKYIAWHCATSAIKNPLCKNANSIGIDVIATKINKKSCSINDNDWFVKDTTWDTATTLIAELCAKHSIPIENVVRHFDVTGKLCPRQFCTDFINEHTKHTGNDDWKMFKEDISRNLATLV